MSPLPEISTYPLSRYRLEFIATSAIRLPEYAGSTLRGAFGHALRQLACATRAKTCQGCMLATSCPYTAVFEPQKPQGGTLALATPPVPYVIEPPTWGECRYERNDALRFHFTLAGRSAGHLNIAIMAWQRALARGVGAGDGTARLETIHHCTPQGETQIYRSGEPVLAHRHMIDLPGDALPSPLTLEFITPLRLQENGCALPPSRITARPLLTALLRRASLLAEYYAGAPLYSAEQFALFAGAAQRIEAAPDLRWRDWTRHSSRQGRTMQLGGCVGRITLQGDLAPFADVLRLGQWLHVGKEASFGLGQYRLLA